MKDWLQARAGGVVDHDLLVEGRSRTAARRSTMGLAACLSASGCLAKLFGCMVGSLLKNHTWALVSRRSWVWRLEHNATRMLCRVVEAVSTTKENKWFDHAE